MSTLPTTSTVRRIFLAALSSLVLVARASAQCPCEQRGVDPLEYLCDDASITSQIPDCVPSETELLVIHNPLNVTLEAFGRFTELKELRLYNHVKRYFAPDAFQNNTQLSEFYILQTTDDYIPDIFAYAPRLEKFGVEVSNLSSLSTDTFRHAANLRHIDLKFNKLTTLRPEHFHGTRLTSLSLAYNPWHCDCELARFVQWARDSGVQFYKFYKDKGTCWQPLELRGVEITTLSVTDLCPVRGGDYDTLNTDIPH